MDEERTIAREISTNGLWVYRLRQIVDGFAFPAKGLRSCCRVLWRRGLVHSPDRKTLQPTSLGVGVLELVETMLREDLD